MSRLWVVLALGATFACGGKEKTVVPVLIDTENDFSPGFLDLTVEDDDLAGAELMIASAECNDLVALEPTALMGKLSDGEVRCLTAAYDRAEKQTHKKKISLLLMADSWTKGDKHRWETIVRRHLIELDQSDPDLCYKFAIHLGQQGPEAAQETLKWVDRALENRSRFPAGDTTVSRVYGLLKLKSQASAKYWAWLEEQYILKPGEEVATQRDLARGQAKTHAREWLEYARSAGKDDTVAYQMCVSAAGSADFCQVL